MKLLFDEFFVKFLAIDQQLFEDMLFEVSRVSWLPGVILCSSRVFEDRGFSVDIKRDGGFVIKVATFNS